MKLNFWKVFDILVQNKVFSRMFFGYILPKLIGTDFWCKLSIYFAVEDVPV